MPNYGREVAIYLDYVAEHYKNPPLATAVVHWHGPNGWHNSCSGMLSRIRYAYRGLASPEWYPDAAEYASHMTTLTRVMNDGDLGLWMNMSLRFMKYPHEERIPAWVTRPDGQMHLHQACTNVFEKYGIDVNAHTFYSCCATFVIPWDRIVSLPLAFYKDFLAVAMSNAERDDPEFGYGCWEFAVWQWYREPPLDARMEDLYIKAENVSTELDLTRCLTPVNNMNPDC
ncbi:hypothetical protein WJX73_002962 [Symbiochloris irregularis]|uniref:Uncharacterized protein n=1 Tax=Symbiochloris irregularis TaxID=706552 RepID=A0AAW1PIL8_9CHLO